MRFLADESCDFTIVRALRDAGEDVSAVGELAPGTDDAAVLDMAQREDRLLLTEDKDFGHLVFAGGFPTRGVILFRYPFASRPLIIRAALDLVRQRGEELPGAFVVIEPGRIRITRPSP